MKYMWVRWGLKFIGLTEASKFLCECDFRGGELGTWKKAEEEEEKVGGGEGGPADVPTSHSD